MNITKYIATLTVAAVLALVSTGQAAINAANENVMKDGATINVVGGTYTDSEIGDATEFFTINESITLSADQWYNMEGRVVVEAGASLTIQPGTVIASTAPEGQGGSLIVVRGAQIFAQGTKDNAIIFTSRTDLENWADDATHPTGKNPRERGVWRPGFNEWGSIAIQGRARISDTRQNDTNPTAFDQFKESPVEGLPKEGLDGVNFYGGLIDSDDSGVFKYVSISYGGDDFDPGTDAELNGMSVGGVGRETDFSHVEIFNNVDDGLEIFGGTINIKCLFVWNIGDDSLDCDQGWRGKGQFILIVQGFAALEDQGSGFGDNGIEIDGTDGDTTAQPITTTALWNVTVIGAPEVLNNSTSDLFSNEADSTDRIVAYRDNTNLQLFNSVFMTVGERVLNNDNVDGDGSTGYGAGTTLDFEERWDTPADWYHDAANGFPNQGSANNSDFLAAYTSQDTNFNLLAVGGSIFYNNDDLGVADDAITNNVVPSNANGAENLTFDNLVILDGGVQTGTTNESGQAASSDAPIEKVIRADLEQSSDGSNFVVHSTKDQGSIGNVISLDPRAAGLALDANRPMMFQPPADGFYSTPTSFRGAVGPIDWLHGWTAISALRNLGANGVADFDKTTGAAGDDEIILCSPEPTGEAEMVAVALAVKVSFKGTKGCLYDIVCIDEDSSEAVIATVEGTGDVVNIADFAELDPCKKYEVRITTH